MDGKKPMRYAYPLIKHLGDKMIIVFKRIFFYFGTLHYQRILADCIFKRISKSMEVMGRSLVLNWKNLETISQSQKTFNNSMQWRSLASFLSWKIFLFHLIESWFDRFLKASFLKSRIYLKFKFILFFYLLNVTGIYK